MKKRLFALLLTLCMALTLVPAAAAAKPLLIAPNPNAAPAWLVPQVKEPTEFPDVTGTWCESYVDTVYRSGLMSGKTAEKFDATSPLTHAQITVICARLYELLTGGDGIIEAVPDTPWYQPSYDLLVEAGILYTDYQGPRWSAKKANAPCEREFFVGLLGSVLETAEVTLPEINEITRIPDISPNFKEDVFYDFDPYIYDFYRYGILNGADPYGGFHENASLTRGAAAAMLARLMDPAQRLEFELPSFDICTDLLGVEHEAVLLIVDGTEITAEQIAYDLAYWLSDTYATPEHLLENAINGITKVVAEYRLGEELGLSMNEETRAWAETYARKEAGYMGATYENWLWRESRHVYYSGIHDLYLYQKYHDKNILEGIDQEIAAKQATLSVERTELLNSLDLNAIHIKCKNSPFGLL